MSLGRQSVWPVVPVPTGSVERGGSQKGGGWVGESVGLQGGFRG